MKLSLLRLDTGARNLLVLLPGACMKGREIVDAGILAEIELRQLELDVIVVDVDFATICDGIALRAVAEEVLHSARQQGRRRIWLGGISLGGLLALCQASQGVDIIDGLCLIAPYPGSRLTLRAIDQAGGLRDWQPTEEQLQDPEFRAWRWLKEPPPNLPAFVGYGRDDRFAESMQRLAECFPPASRCTVPGGHDWTAWRQLWSRFLDLGHFGG